jgi:hypothetical protein
VDADEQQKVTTDFADLIDREDQSNLLFATLNSVAPSLYVAAANQKFSLTNLTGYFFIVEGINCWFPH